MKEFDCGWCCGAFWGRNWAIIARAFLGTAEGSVGFAYLYEVVRGVRVVGVQVGVGGFGEGVELSSTTRRD